MGRPVDVCAEEGRGKACADVNAPVEQMGQELTILRKTSAARSKRKPASAWGPGGLKLISWNGGGSSTAQILPCVSSFRQDAIARLIRLIRSRGRARHFRRFVTRAATIGFRVDSSLVPLTDFAIRTSAGVGPSDFDQAGRSD